jgi:hypothetical protein
VVGGSQAAVPNRGWGWAQQIKTRSPGTSRSVQLFIKNADKGGGHERRNRLARQPCSVLMMLRPGSFFEL